MSSSATSPTVPSHRATHRRLLEWGVFCGLAFLSPGLVATSSASPIEVTTTAASSTAECTLTDAVAAALSASPAGACAYGGEAVVKIEKDKIYWVPAPFPAIDGPLTVRGDASAVSPAKIRFETGAPGRFFDVLDQGHLVLTNLQLEGGQADFGGAIRVRSGGSLDLFGVVLEGHAAAPSGGALYNEGQTQVASSTLRGNSATFGGAIHNAQGGTLTMRSSLLSSNTSSQGAIYQNGGALDVETSTFSANQAYLGGAFYGKSGASTFEASTFRNNDATAGLGGTFFMEWGALTYGRSAFTAQTTQASLCFGAFYLSSAGDNALSDATCGAPAASDQVLQGPISMSDLVHHGGLTEVHVPICEWSTGRCESPVLDRLSCCALGECPAGVTPIRDQRDQFPRRDVAGAPISPSGGDLCDIGAYESVCESFIEDGQGTTTVMLHEYQVLDGPPVLLDNGSCYTHPLFQGAPSPPPAGGCRLQWQVYGPRIEVQDVIFLTADCPVDCFADPDGCATVCQDDPPAGWVANEQGGLFGFDVADCASPPSGLLRYLLELRDKLDPEAQAWRVDPQTPIEEDDVPIIPPGS